MRAFFFLTISQGKDHYDGIMKNKVLLDIKEAEKHHLVLTKRREVHFDLDY
jgi:hypothetical protein